MRRSPLLHAARAALVGFFACSTAHAQLHFWDGGGADNNWTTPGNWVVNMFFNAPPTSGAGTVIMQGTLRPNPLVDDDYDILALSFSGGGGAGPFTFQAGGEPLSIRSGGIINNDTDLQIISRVALGESHTWNAAAGPLQVNFVTLGGLATGSMLTVSGAFDTSVQGTIGGSVITGAGSILLNSGANFTLAGFAGQHNTFTGPVTVNSGTLILNKPAGVVAVPGNLIIGDGAGSDVAKLGQSNQIADTSNVTVNSSGLFNLTGGTETIANLTMNGGSVTTGGGTLAVSSDVISNAGSVTGRIHGWLNVAGNVSVADGAALDDLEITGSLDQLHKTGPGQLVLSGSGAISNVLHVHEGTAVLRRSEVATLRVGDNVGSPGTGVLRIEEGGSFHLQNPDPVVSLYVQKSGLLDLNGRESGARVLHMQGGHIVTGSGTLSVGVQNEAGGEILVEGQPGVQSVIEGNLRFHTAPGMPAFITHAPISFGVLDLAGTIHGAGHGMVVQGYSGTTRISGATANQPTGVLLSDGTLILAKSVPNGAVYTLWVGLGTVILEANEQINDDSGVGFALRIDSGRFMLNGFSETIDDVVLEGGTIETGAGTLSVLGSVTGGGSISQMATITGNLRLGDGPRTFDFADGPAALELDVQASIYGNGSIRKQGEGVLRLAGQSAFSGGVELIGGALRLASDGALGTGALTANVATLVRSESANLTISNPLFGIDDFTIETATGMNWTGPIDNARKITKLGGATLTLSGAQTHAPGAILDVVAGTARLGSDAGAGGANLNVSVSTAAARLEIASTQRLASLNVSAGQAALETGGNKVLSTKSLFVDTTDALIDIWEHAVIIDYTGGSPLTSIKSAILSAYNGGSWDGFGITSSLADALTFAVGYGEATALELTSFEGESLDGPALLVKYTYYGDANLDGTVNVADLVKLASNWKLSGLWTEGDFNYDGFVDKIDLRLMALNWHAGNVTPLGPALEAMGLPASVPEPAHLAGFLIAAGILPRRRRRKQRFLPIS